MYGNLLSLAIGILKLLSIFNFSSNKAMSNGKAYVPKNTYISTNLNTAGDT